MKQLTVDERADYERLLALEAKREEKKRKAKEIEDARIFDQFDYLMGQGRYAQ